MEHTEEPIAPATSPSGWWKCPSGLGTSEVYLRVSDQRRLAAVGLYVSAIGFALSHDSGGWVPRAGILFGQVCACTYRGISGRNR